MQNNSYFFLKVILVELIIVFLLVSFNTARIYLESSIVKQGTLWSIRIPPEEIPEGYEQLWVMSDVGVQYNISINGKYPYIHYEKYNSAVINYQSTDDVIAFYPETATLFRWKDNYKISTYGFVYNVGKYERITDIPYAKINKILFPSYDPVLTSH